MVAKLDPEGTMPLDNLDEVKPIKPDEVANKKAGSIPGPVIQAFNDLIVENWNDNSKSSNFTLDEVATLAMKNLHATEKYQDIDREQMFDYGWLDVEAVYRQNGWKVHYDKAVAYGGDTYASNFTFSKK